MVRTSTIRTVRAMRALASMLGVGSAVGCGKPEVSSRLDLRTAPRWLSSPFVAWSGAVVLAGALGLAPAAGAAAGGARPVRVIAEAPRLLASEDLGWTLGLRVTGLRGARLDSLTVDVLDLSPGETRYPRTTHLS